MFPTGAISRDKLVDSHLTINHKKFCLSLWTVFTPQLDVVDQIFTV